MTTNKEMKELNPEMMEQISGGIIPLFPGIPGDPPYIPETPKDEPKDGGATGSW